jgi:predicted amidohydrolase YtcJ
LTRATPSNFCNVGAAQAISRTQAFSMWTRDAARVLQWADIGLLRPGHHADLIVVDRDPITCTVEALGSTQVLQTMFAGDIVYDAGVR